MKKTRRRGSGNWITRKPITGIVTVIGWKHEITVTRQSARYWEWNFFYSGVHFRGTEKGLPVRYWGLDFSTVRQWQNKITRKWHFIEIDQVLGMENHGEVLGIGRTPKPWYSRFPPFYEFPNPTPPAMRNPNYRIGASRAILTIVKAAKDITTSGIPRGSNPRPPALTYCRNRSLTTSWRQISFEFLLVKNCPWTKLKTWHRSTQNYESESDLVFCPGTFVAGTGS